MTEINSYKEGDIDPETVMLNINLQGLIEEIDKHFIRTLEMHEDDFKLAYRGQMLKVKRELQHLKNKADEAERKLMEDESILKLKHSIVWFKNEGLKLDETLEG
jgi:hypothetical protein